MIYIVGSDRFWSTKSMLFTNLKLGNLEVEAVGFSEKFNSALKNKDFNALHDLEDKSIESADLIIVVNGDIKDLDKTYIGEDTMREINLAKKINKKIVYII